eukprot:312418-Lingulodinium_polyedra.AAC.1
MRPDEETTADAEAETEPITHAPLSQVQKDIIPKIHNYCGHPSKEEFVQALRLARATDQVLRYVRHAFQCPA